MTCLCYPSCGEGTAVMQCGRRTNGYVALFVFAALVGLLGQTVVPWLSDQLNSPHLGFRFLVSDIDIYPFVVVALITFGNTEPKRAFWRVLVFFPACAWATTGTRPPLPPIAHLSPAARAILRTSCPAQRTRSSTWPSRCARARGGSPCRGARAGASCTRRCWFRS